MSDDEKTQENPDEATAGGEEWDEEKSSDWASAMTKIFRLQYGLMAGAAKSMTKTTEIVEKFLDELADETDIKDSDSWSDVLGKMPEGLASATRAALDECETIPQAMADAFKEYSGDDKT